ncbi:hypothetical protein [Aeromonas media]|uniref:hypothetical protein n=1 Tax=Aeromonas media TaxID=651 RepID=UPI0015FC4EC9|nr:hypothetical protein [Aeromonas media]
MNAAIIALFAQHGPMTVTEAMAKGLGQICDTCHTYNARHYLNKLLASGNLIRRSERRELPGGIGRYPRQSTVVIYQVKPRGGKA